MQNKLSEIWRAAVVRGALLALACSPSLSLAKTLTLPEASRMLLAQHPQLQEYRARLDAQQAQTELAAQRPALNLSLDSSEIAGTGSYQGVDSAQTTLALSSIWERGNQRQTRQALASTQTELLLTRQELQRMQLLSALTSGFVQALAQQEHCRLQQDTQQLKQQSLRLVQERVRKAAAPEAEQWRAQVAWLQAKQAYAACQAELASRYQSLASLMGQEQVNFDQLQGELYSPKALAEPQDTSHSPMLALFAKERAAQEAELASLQARSQTDVQWRLGVTHYAQSQDAALGLGVEIPLFTSLRNKPQLYGAQAQLQVLQAQEQQARQQLLAEFAQAKRMRQQSLAQAQSLSHDIIPLLERAYLQAQSAYQQGRYSYSEWVNAGQELLNAKAQLIDASAQAWLSLVVIERLTSTPSKGN